MKKYLIAFLATLACILTITAFGCKSNGNNNSGNPNDDPPVVDDEYTVEFMPTENLKYVYDGSEVEELTLTVESGAVVNFSVSVPVLYEVPAVYANGNSLKAQDEVYSLTVTEDITVTTAEVKMPMAVIPGSGTSDDPLLLSSPSDYIYIAECINAGNTSFTSLFYALEDDIDFGGANIPVIGDGSTPTSVFMGNFNGNGFTISNFKIKTQGISYVGLFGYVVSSGNNDGSGLIVNVKIDDFEIEANADELGSMFIGSFVGYSIASSVIACSATNGYISVHADNAAFSYVGGAVGVQNSAILTNGNDIQYYPASTSYVHTNVDINCSGGVFASGGVVGYVVSEHERAISSVLNSYSEGEVSGGIYSGGVVGNLGDYSSIANCYSLSNVSGYSRYRDNESYSHVYAGGLVGYLGNNAVVTDSFAKNGFVEGSSASGASYVHTGDLTGGKAAATVVLGEAVVFNCYFGSSVTLTTNFFKNSLWWQDCDWVIDNGSYPTINMDEAEENSFVVTFQYLDKAVDGVNSKTLDISLSEEFYSPLFYFYGEEFGDVVVADSGETSYGYFFDEELTQRVPYGFIPTRNISLYTAFADYSEVAGKYYLVSRVSNREITLTLNTDSSYVYNDGVEFVDFYTYDGTKIIFNNALFARLSDFVGMGYDGSGAEIARPDLNYGFNKFAAVKTAGGLDIFDGSFFAEKDPLLANRYALSGEWYDSTYQYVFYTDLTGKRNGQSFTYTYSADRTITLKIGSDTVSLNLSSLSKYDAFKGVWEIASNVNRKYEFDGKGNWTYTIKGSVKDSGTYSIDNGVATLKSNYTAEIDASGLLLIEKNGNKEYFAKTGSFTGTWVDSNNNIIIYIDGFGSSLAGSAIINIGGATSELTYILDGFFDGDGNTHVTLLSGYALFGYLTCHVEGGLVVSFTGTFFASSTSEYLDGYNFYLLDALEGDWVGEGTLGGVSIDSLVFNGLGIHGNGSVSLNGEDGTEYTLDGNFDATFGGYKVEFDDENDVIKITLGSETAELYRKDEISAYVLISEDGTKYSFNGGGNLSKGGKLTVTDSKGNEVAVLGYKKVSGSIEGLDLVIDLYSSFRGTQTVGTITIKDYKFEFNYTGSVTGLPQQATLTIDNPFTGTWCVSDFSTNIVIDKFDLSNKTTGFFLDMTGSVTFTYYPQYNSLMVPYQTREMTVPVALYLIMLSDGNMAISSYEVLTTGDDLIYCAPSDGLYGDWYDRDQIQKTLKFDGMADSLYTVGVARNEMGELFFYTRRFGTLYFWSADGERAYTITRNGDVKDGSIVYNNAKNYRIFIVFDSFDLTSCILSAENGDTVYDFYLTHVEVNGVEKNYMLASVKGDVTELVIYENDEDTKGVRYKVNHAENTIEAVV